jgi:imidazolonepropionase
MQAYINIKSIVQTNRGKVAVRGENMAFLPTIDDGFLLIDNKKIVDFGSMSVFDFEKNHEIIDCTDRYILPTYCDSHTHVVFAATREAELLQRLKGASYLEIAAAGGGILNSALRLQTCDEQQLYDDAFYRIEKMIQTGTGAIEIKSGYGLSVDAELKMLRVIRKLKENLTLPIKATLLAAHAFPAIYKSNRAAYVALIIDQILPQCVDAGLVDYCDAFVENGFFTVAEADQIFEKASALNIKIKVHANQLSNSGGVKLGVGYNATSVDHLEHLDAEDYRLLSGSDTVATLLPSAAFFLNDSMPDAIELIKNNAIVALASDYNPGTSPSGNMNFVNSLAAIKMKMTTEMCINASTINGAFAMDVHHQLGSIDIGKNASFIITEKIQSIDAMPYSFGSPSIYKVII